MEKIQLEEFKGKIGMLKSYGDRSSVFQLLDGSFLKLYSELYLEESRLCGVNIEAKILDSANRGLLPGIVKPHIAFYSGDKFVGDISRSANGISYGDWEAGLTEEQRNDLGLYGNVYCGLEKIIKSTPDIVYPDVCSYDNIFVGNNGTTVELIDYEGFQVDDYPFLSFSSGLGDKNLYQRSSKYCKRQGVAPLYTKELDVRSLIFFYFRTVFDVDLRLVDQYGVDLEIFFRAINLNESDIMHKVWKLFQESEKNEWLGDDVQDLATKYKLEGVQGQVKRLVRR